MAVDGAPVWPDELRRPDCEAKFRSDRRCRILGGSVHWLIECTSTNDLGRTLAESGAPDGTIVAADRQTAGRGRKGDPWHSPGGEGLWCSFVLYPRVGSGHAATLTVALAEALRKVLATELGLAATIKPPNDVLLGGRKLAGILAEAVTVGNEAIPRFVVLGVGVNLTTRFPEALAAIATSLAEHLPPERVPEAPLLLAWLAAAFEPAYAGMTSGA